MTRSISSGCRALPVVALVALAAVSPVRAGKPQLSVNVRNGDFSFLESLDPSIRWSTDGTVFGGDGDGDDGESRGLDYAVGAELSFRPLEDASPLPRSVFAKIGRKFGCGWGLSARADVDFDSAADVDLRAENDDVDLAFKVSGTAGTDLDACRVRTLEARKGGLNLFGSTVAVNPRFNVASRSGDVVVSCQAGGSTNVKVAASLDEQKFTLSQTILDNNVITPSITTGGDFALQMKRKLADDKSISATIKPNDSVSVQWTDGAWVADFDAPVEGISLDSINIKVRRKIDVY